MRYLIPRERDGSQHTIQIGGDTADADAYARWKDDGGVVEQSPPPDFPADDVKAECGRRIYAVAGDNAQKNMLATIVSGAMSTADKATFASGVAWIAATQATCRDLIAVADPAFADDAKWPVVPDGVAELAARF